MACSLKYNGSEPFNNCSSPSLISSAELCGKISEAVLPRISVRGTPHVFSQAIDEDEPPAAGVLHENRDRHILHDQIQEIPVSVALVLRGDLFGGVLVPGQPSPVLHRPRHGMDRASVRGALHRAGGFALGNRGVEHRAILIHVLGKIPNFLLMTKEI